MRWLRLQQMFIDKLPDCYTVRLSKNELTLTIKDKFVAAVSIDQRPECGLPAFHARYAEGESERISLGYIDEVVTRTVCNKLEQRRLDEFYARIRERLRAKRDNPFTPSSLPLLPFKHK